MAIANHKVHKSHEDHKELFKWPFVTILTFVGLSDIAHRTSDIGVVKPCRLRQPLLSAGFREAPRR